MGESHRSNKIYLAEYTLFWMAGALFIYFLLKWQGRNLMWYTDGVYQHFPAFNYICDITESVLHGKMGFSGIWPVQYSIGQGVDLFTTLNSYDLADPVSWLSSALLFMTRVQRYTIMVLAKLWLTGAAFSLYCFIVGHKKNLAIICGSLAYTFSGTILFMFTRHPNYINWGYFLPLFLGGYELYRRCGRKRLLAAATFMNLVVSFYTLYINAILLVIYVLTRTAAEVWKNRTPKTLAEELILDIRAAGACVIGALLGAFSLLPTIYAFSQNPRVADVSGYIESIALYGAKFYKETFVVLFAPYIRAEYTTVVGLLCVNLIAILYFYMTRSRDNRTRALKLYAIVMMLMLCSPLAGKIMNGMGYPSNRWDYAVAFASAMILTESFDALSQCSWTERIRIAVVGGIYVLVCFLMRETLPGFNKTATLVMLSVMLCAFLLSGCINSGNRAAVLAAMTAICMMFQIYCFYAPQAGDYASQFEKMEDHAEDFTDSSQLLAGRSSEEDFFRTESMESTVNIDRINRVNGTNAWWSLLPGAMLNYLNDFELNSVLQNCWFEGLDGRTALLELAGVKYYTKAANDTSSAPYGYVYAEDLSDDSFSAYKNEYALPVCYTFRSYISRDQFAGLNAVQRQEAVLQGAVLDEDSINKLPEEFEERSVKSSAYQLQYERQTHNGISLTDHTILTNEVGGQISLIAEIPENTEIYLQIEGIEIVEPNARNINVFRSNWKTGFKITKRGRITNLADNWPVVREGITFNLGTGGAGKNRIKLIIPPDSEFRYNSIKLWAAPMDTYRQQAEELLAGAAENVRVNGKQISAAVDIPESRILQIAVPYSIGWHCHIDGKKTDVLRSDGLYMAVVVPEGRHEIVLRYSTPYLRAGLTISLLTLFVLLGVCGWNKKKKK